MLTLAFPMNLSRVLKQKDNKQQQVCLMSLPYNSLSKKKAFSSLYLLTYTYLHTSKKFEFQFSLHLRLLKPPYCLFFPRLRLLCCCKYVYVQYYTVQQQLVSRSSVRRPTHHGHSSCCHGLAADLNITSGVAK